MVEEVDIILFMGDAFDFVFEGMGLSNLLWLTKLQLWSVRVVLFRCE